MKLHLNRISNLFRPEFQKNCLILCGLFFLLPLVFILIWAWGSRLLWILLPLLLLCNLAWFLTLLLGFPKTLQISGGVLSFTEYYEVSPGDRKRISFTLTGVREITYLQNKLEKKLNIGRVRFRADAELEPSHRLPQRQTKIFCLCGIKKFEAFRRDFPELLKK